MSFEDLMNLLLFCFVFFVFIFIFCSLLINNCFTGHWKGFI
jgi:hypothetical protein